MGTTGLSSDPKEYRSRLDEQTDEQIDAWAAELMRDVSIRRGVRKVVRDFKHAAALDDAAAALRDARSPARLPAGHEMRVHVSLGLSLRTRALRACRDAPLGPIGLAQRAPCALARHEHLLLLLRRLCARIAEPRRLLRRHRVRVLGLALRLTRHHLPRLELRLLQLQVAACVLAPLREDLLSAAALSRHAKVAAVLRREEVQRRRQRGELLRRSPCLRQLRPRLLRSRWAGRQLRKLFSERGKLRCVSAGAGAARDALGLGSQRMKNSEVDFYETERVFYKLINRTDVKIIFSLSSSVC